MKKTWQKILFGFLGVMSLLNGMTAVAADVRQIRQGCRDIKEASAKFELVMAGKEIMKVRELSGVCIYEDDSRHEFKGAVFIAKIDGKDFFCFDEFEDIPEGVKSENIVCKTTKITSSYVAPAGKWLPFHPTY